MKLMCFSRNQACDCLRPILVVAAFLLGARVATAQGSLTSLQDAWVEWENYRKSAATLQGDVETVFLTGTRQVTSRGKSTIQQTSQSFLMFSQTLFHKKGRTSGSMRVQNASYEFELTRPSETAPWTLVHLADRSASDPLDPMISARNMVLKLMDHAITIAGSPLALPELTREADFKVLSLRPSAPGSGLVRLTFEMPARRLEPRVVNAVQVDNGWLGTRKGWMDLDPNLMGVVRDYDVEYEEMRGQVKHVYFVSGRHEYERDAAGPKLTRSTMTSRKAASRDSEVISSWERTYRLDRTTPPEAVFTLSHYGFPEPERAGRSVPAYLWALGGAAVCVGLIALLRWRTRPSARGVAA